MSKDLNKAYLNHKKSLKINEINMCKVEFDNVISQLMKRKTNMSPHGLQDLDMEEIERAQLFWQEMVDHALKFLEQHSQKS